MTNQHHYNPVISNKLNGYVRAKNWTEILNYLSNLSHSQFRTACNILSEEVLTALDTSTYWECFGAVVKTNTKAFLQTFLKAGVNNYCKNRLTICDAHLEAFGKWVCEGKTIVDERKVLQAFLPILKTTEEIEFLFKTFQIEDVQKKISYLIQSDSAISYYVLFQCFRKMDHEPMLLSEYCNQLIEKGTNRSFNLVSIMKCYFDLPCVRGQFSLQLNAYELSRLDSSFEDFEKILCRM